MVSTASPAAQASEMEKKRKQTLERAKANHLSRQLQMRLQYARLKVEHGWQRQNLNEVENLYFHHSHLRGLKPYPTSSSLAAAPSENAVIFSPSKYSDTSYKVWFKTSSQSSPLDTLLDPGQETTGNPGSSTQMPAPLSQLSVGPHSFLSGPSTLSMSAEVQTSRVSERSQTLSHMPSPLYNGNTPLDAGTPSDLPSQTAAATTAAPIIPPEDSTHQQSQLLTSLPLTSGSTNLIATVPTPTPLSTSKTKKPLSGHKNASALTTKDMFNFNTTSLTYDSFWSGLQSKSYPALKHGGSAASAGLGSGSSVNGTSGTSAGNLFNGTSPTPSPAAITITPPLSAPPAQDFASTITSTSPPPLSPSVPGFTHPSTSPSITPAPTPPLPSPSTPASILTAPLPGSASPTTLTLQSQQLELQMQQNRLFADNLATWTLITSQQYPGATGSPQNLIPVSLLTNPATFPFLASYTQAFNTAGVSVHPPGISSVNTDSGGPMTPPTVASVPSVSASVPPVVSAFVGQQEG